MVENKNVHTKNACGYDGARVGVAVSMGFPQRWCNGMPDESLRKIVSIELDAVDSAEEWVIVSPHYILINLIFAYTKSFQYTFRFIWTF